MIVLVTGGSSGIGLATVRRLASAGHQVFAASRRPSRADLPESVVPVVLDLASAESTLAGLQQVVEKAGGLDVLVNNAGANSVSAVEETDEDEARYVFDVNFFGPMRLARLAVPVMRARGGGRIINVTSMNDVMAAPFGAWYSASKAALASASVVLGSEVRAFGISVTVVAPGLFRTEMADGLGEITVDPDSLYRAELSTIKMFSKERLKGAGDPDEVARAIEACMESDEPPARVAVGADAQSFEKLVRESTPEEFSKLLQDYVAELRATGSAS